MMYRKRNQVKNAFVLFLSALALLTTLSCSNLFSDGKETYNLSGIFIKIGAGAGRTAIPTVSDLTYYSALVPQGTPPTTIQPMTKQGDGYLVNLGDEYSEGTYTLYVYGFTADATSFTPEAANVIASDKLVLTSGKTTYSLFMTLEANTTNIQKGTFSLNVTSKYFSDITASLVDADNVTYRCSVPGYTRGTLCAIVPEEELPAGKYTITITGKFGTGSSDPAFTVTDTVSIYPGCTTNIWYDRDSKVSKETKNFDLSELAFYVATTGNDTALGGQDTPLASVQEAINRIQAITNSTNGEVNEFTVYLTGTFSAKRTDSPGIIKLSCLSANDTAAPIIHLVGTGSGAVIDAEAQMVDVIMLKVESDSPTLTPVVSIDNITLENNWYGQAGSPEYAPILITSYSTLIMNSGTITGNDSGCNGGAILVDEHGTFEMNGGTIRDNTAISYNGGAIYSFGTVIIHGGTITRNEASISRPDRPAGGNGGAIYIAGGSFIMTGGTISENSAINRAGLDDSGNGGGIYIAGGSFTMTGGTIKSNHAGDKGGGMYIDIEDSTKFTMSGGTMKGNTAETGNTIYNAGSDIMIAKMDDESFSSGDLVDGDID